MPTDENKVQDTESADVKTPAVTSSNPSNPAQEAESKDSTSKPPSKKAKPSKSKASDEPPQVVLTQDEESKPSSSESPTGGNKTNEVEALESEANPPELAFQVAEKTLDLNLFALGRHFSTFPISPNRVDALNHQGFGYATRMQTAMLDYGLAQLSVCCPLSVGNSRYLTLCVSALERCLDGVGRVIIVSQTDHLTDLICTDLLSFAGGQTLKIMAIKESEELAEQRAALHEGVDILVGSAGRIANLLADRPSKPCLFLGFCDLSFTQKDQSIEALFAALTSSEQVFGFYSSPIRQDFFERLKAFDPSVTLVDFSMRTKEHKRQIVQSSNKMSDAVSLALSTERSIAFVCDTEEQSQQLLSELSVAGVSARLLWSQSNRRTKEKILRQMRSNKVQCLLLTEANVDRNVASEIILLSIPENLSSITGFPGTVTWLIGEGDDTSSLDSLSPKPIAAASFTDAQGQRHQRILDSLLQSTPLCQSTVWNPLTKAVLEHPQKEALINVALSHFAAIMRAESHERMEEISRMEANEEPGKPPQKRHKRRGRYRRRR